MHRHHVVRFIEELRHLIVDGGHLTENDVMLVVLGLRNGRPAD